jgi:hypothetical protein
LIKTNYCKIYERKIFHLLIDTYINDYIKIIQMGKIMSLMRGHGAWAVSWVRMRW